MTLSDQALIDLHNANRKLGLHPIDRFDTEPETLASYQLDLDVMELALNSPDGVQGEPR